MSSVQVIGATRSFGSTAVLRGLSLQVEAGEFLVLLGPSGCGKSTLLHAIAGLEDLDAGQVLIGGRDVSAVEPQHRGIAMVFQSYALYPTMTVRENLSFGLRMARVDRREIDRRVSTAAEMLQLGDLLDRRPSQLSGGQRQRVAIGRAVVRQVSVFLFDEPLSNLDAQLRTEMRVELKRLHAELGATMIYVTHDQTEAMTLASRVAVLRAGAIEQCDTPQALYDRPLNRFVATFVGSPQINLLPGALFGHPGVELGIRPEDLRPMGPETPGAVPARLLLREPLGAETLVWCDTCGHRICMRLPPSEAAGLTEHFHLIAELRKATHFDPDTGLRTALRLRFPKP